MNAILVKVFKISGVILTLWLSLGGLLVGGFGILGNLGVMALVIGVLEACLGVSATLMICNAYEKYVAN